MIRALTLLLVLVAAGAAQADCEADLKVLAPQVQSITDPGTKRRAERYLVRALRELDEGDELDCRPAADAVRDFLDKAAARAKAAGSASGSNGPDATPTGGAALTN